MPPLALTVIYSYDPTYKLLFNKVLKKLIKKLMMKKIEEVKIYTTNYNILRFMSGMGGLAYSN